MYFYTHRFTFPFNTTTDDREMQLELRSSLQWWNEYYFVENIVYLEEDDIDTNVEGDNDEKVSSTADSSPLLHGYGFFGPIVIENYSSESSSGEDTLLEKRKSEATPTAITTKKGIVRRKKKRDNRWDDDNTSTTGSRLDSSMIDSNIGDDDKDDKIQSIRHLDNNMNSSDDDDDDHNNEDLLAELILCVRDGFDTSARFTTMMLESHKQPQDSTQLLCQRLELLAFKLTVHVHILKAQTTSEDSSSSSRYARKVWKVIKTLLAKNYDDGKQHLIDMCKSRVITFLDLGGVNSFRYNI